MYEEVLLVSLYNVVKTIQTYHMYRAYKIVIFLRYREISPTAVCCEKRHLLMVEIVMKSEKSVKES